MIGIGWARRMGGAKVYTPPKARATHLIAVLLHRANAASMKTKIISFGPIDAHSPCCLASMANIPQSPWLSFFVKAVWSALLQLLRGSVIIPAPLHPPHGSVAKAAHVTCPKQYMHGSDRLPSSVL